MSSLTTAEMLTLIVSQGRTVYVSGRGGRALGYLAQRGDHYRVIDRATGAELARFTLADVKCAAFRGEEFAVVELKEVAE